MAQLTGGLTPVLEARALEEAGTPPGGVQPVPAPGHTPGHTAFLLADRGVLLAGDAVANILTLRPSPRPVTTDLTAARRSIAALAGLRFDTLAMGHGPPITRRARERLEALAW